jgi:hypothetical protein
MEQSVVSAAIYAAPISLLPRPPAPLQLGLLPHRRRTLRLPSPLLLGRPDELGGTASCPSCGQLPGAQAQNAAPPRSHPAHAASPQGCTPGAQTGAPGRCELPPPRVLRRPALPAPLTPWNCSPIPARCAQIGRGGGPGVRAETGGAHACSRFGHGGCSGAPLLPSQCRSRRKHCARSSTSPVPETPVQQKGALFTIKRR